MRDWLILRSRGSIDVQIAARFASPRVVLWPVNADSYLARQTAPTSKFSLQRLVNGVVQLARENGRYYRKVAATHGRSPARSPVLYRPAMRISHCLCRPVHKRLTAVEISQAFWFTQIIHLLGKMGRTEPDSFLGGSNGGSLPHSDGSPVLAEESLVQFDVDSGWQNFPSRTQPCSQYWPTRTAHSERSAASLRA